MVSTAKIILTILIIGAAAFGAEQPLTPNVDEAARAQNRRVEMAPVPKASNAKAATP